MIWVSNNLNLRFQIVCKLITSFQNSSLADRFKTCFLNARRDIHTSIHRLNVHVLVTIYGNENLFDFYSSLTIYLQICCRAAIRRHGSMTPRSFIIPPLWLAMFITVEGKRFLALRYWGCENIESLWQSLWLHFCLKKAVLFWILIFGGGSLPHAKFSATVVARG